MSVLTGYRDDADSIEAWPSTNWSGYKTIRIRHFQEEIELTEEQFERLVKWWNKQ